MHIQPKHHEPHLVSLTEQMRNQVRYEDEDDKLEVKSDYSDGEPVKCIIPSSRNRVGSFQARPKPQSNMTTYYPYKQKYKGTSQKRPESFHRHNQTTNIERAISQNKER